MNKKKERELIHFMLFYKNLTGTEIGSLLCTQKKSK